MAKKATTDKVRTALLTAVFAVLLTSGIWTAMFLMTGDKLSDGRTSVVALLSLAVGYLLLTSVQRKGRRKR